MKMKSSRKRFRGIEDQLSQREQRYEQLKRLHAQQSHTARKLGNPEPNVPTVTMRVDGATILRKNNNIPVNDGARYLVKRQGHYLRGHGFSTITDKFDYNFGPGRELAQAYSLEVAEKFQKILGQGIQLVKL